MRLWKDVEPGLRSLVQDELQENIEPKYAQSDLLTWWTWAQDDFAAYHPLRQSRVYQVSDGNPIELPEDYAKVQAVWWEGHKSLTQIPLGESLDFYSHQVNTASYPLGYVVGGGQLWLTRAPVQPWTLFYLAHYPAPIGEDSPILLPRWGVQACTFYAASMAAARESFSTADLRQYATRMDSGNPEHNPLEKTARFLMEQYRNLMSAHSDDEE
jgi:hypothetical protein